MTAPVGWQIKPLSEVVSIQRGFDLPHHARRSGPFPVLTSGETGGFHDEGPIKGPGVTIGRATNLGQPKWSEGDFWPHNTTMFVKDFMGNLPRWVFHFFENTDFAGYDSGSVQPMLNRNYIAQVPVLVPPTEEQQAIAEVLGALDDKIAINRELAQTAEQLLQASYRGLVDVMPSRQVLVESLVRRITPKRKFAKEELLTQGDFPVFDQSDSGFLGYLNGAGFLEANAEEPILYFGDHTCKLRIAAERFTVGPNTVPFTGSGIPSLTLYCALNGLQDHEEYKRHWQLLMKREVSIPDAQPAADFALRHGSILTLLKSVSRENSYLAATRDALLPQLMSGKLRVRDAERVLEEAGV